MKGEYDFTAKMYDPLLYIFLNRIRKEVIKELLEYKDKSIIDLCCGTGNQLKLLAKNDFKSLHCLDISNSMLQVAKKGDYNLKFYHQDATNTSFDNNSFDAAIISFAVHEKDRNTQERFLEEAYRILKDDSILLIVDFDYDSETPRVVKGFITMIERMAGKEHFNNYQNYTKNNGLKSLIDQDKFKVIKRNRKAFNGVSISIYKKI